MTDAGSSCGCCKGAKYDIGEQKMELYLDIILKNVKEKASIFCVKIAILAKIEFEAKNSKTIKINPISFKSKLKIFIAYL